MKVELPVTPRMVDTPTIPAAAIGAGLLGGLNLPAAILGGPLLGGTLYFLHKDIKDRIKAGKVLKSERAKLEAKENKTEEDIAKLKAIKKLTRSNLINTAILTAGGAGLGYTIGSLLPHYTKIDKILYH